MGAAREQVKVLEESTVPAVRLVVEPGLLYVYVPGFSRRVGLCYAALHVFTALRLSVMTALP